jgi:hypothetical protein
MEKINLQNEVKVFGVRVKTFPEGIGEVFDSLIKMLPKGDNRSYYGISEFKNGSMHYYATTEETFPGEGKKYNCDSLTIEKGEYLTVTLHGWRTKTNTITDIFREILKDKRVDHTKPAVEWYKNDKEMFCMVRIDPSKIKMVNNP